jgi:hypothetical protein
VRWTGPVGSLRRGRADVAEHGGARRLADAGEQLAAVVVDGEGLDTGEEGLDELPRAPTWHTGCRLVAVAAGEDDGSWRRGNWAAGAKSDSQEEADPQAAQRESWPESAIDIYATGVEYGN